ncbi:hypothetical protein Tco_1569646 [Tanacetum coccineum]
MAKPIQNEARAEQNLAVPSIKSNVKYELDEELLKELRSNTYNGRVEEDVVSHIAKILEILDLIKIAGVDHFQLRMMTFPLSVSRDARKWWMNEGDGKINTWEELVNKFLSKLYPLSCASNYDKMCDDDEEEVGNNEGLMDEVISSDDDRDHTDSSMITKPEIKIGDEFLKILYDNSFNGVDGSDVTDHIAKVLEITEWIKIPNVDKDELRLHVFSKSLSGDAKKWNCIHYEDGNPARAYIKQALGSFKDGDGDGDTHYERSHKGVKASANSDIVYFFTSAQDGNTLQDDERLDLADDLMKAQVHNQRQVNDESKDH